MKMTATDEPTRPNKALILLCSVAAILAVALSVVSLLSYNRSSHEKKELLSNLETLTARYNNVVNDNKMLSDIYDRLDQKSILANADKELVHKSSKNLEDAAKFNKESESLKKEIGELKAQLEELKSQFPEGYFEMDEGE